MQNTRAVGIARKTRKKKSNVKKLDPKKEELIRSLMSICGDAGYAVRREKLKRGPNWSVQSGLCAVHGETCVFVDRASSQDDQVDFLLSAVRDLEISVSEEREALLPPSLVKMLQAESFMAVAS
ncbi:hypothetical protein MRY87_07380 [bacterium]|nr:hypothetical protein [bacterium]